MSNPNPITTRSYWLAPCLWRNTKLDFHRSKCYITYYYLFLYYRTRSTHVYIKHLSAGKKISNVKNSSVKINKHNNSTLVFSRAHTLGRTPDNYQTQLTIYHLIDPFSITDNMSLIISAVMLVPIISFVIIALHFEIGGIDEIITIQSSSADAILRT